MSDEYLTDDDMTALASVIERMTGNVPVVVESIIRRHRAAALEEAAAATYRISQAQRGTPEFDLWISEMTEPDIAEWLRARAAELSKETA